MYTRVSLYEAGKHVNAGPIALAPRQTHILSAAVRHYLEKGEPAGSHHVAERIGERVSTATIRSEMAQLEDLGYLAQPHTSAGRVPTDAGYRFYVNQLMKRTGAPAPREQASIRSHYGHVGELEPVLRVTCRVLAEMTRCASVAAALDCAEDSITHLELTRLDQVRLLFLLVVSSGRVSNSLHRLRQAPAARYLASLSRALTLRLGGVPISQVQQEDILEVIRALPRRKDESALLEVVTEGLRRSQQYRLYLWGTANIVGERAFQDPRQLRQVMSFLEEETGLRELLARTEARPLAVIIGSEAGHPSLTECALVLASYPSGPRPVGKVGILGPKRISYARALAVVNFVARTLGESLSQAGLS